MNDPLEPPRQCLNCGLALPLGALACEKCHTLVYGERLAQISHRAQTLQEEDSIQAARDEWSNALALLPSNATQAEWIRSQIAKLDLVLRTQSPAKPKHEWIKRFGPLAPLLLLLSKGKFLLTAIFKLKFLLSFIGFLAVYWSLYGAQFGIGFVVLILVHEMGHYVDIRRRGLPAEMPVFLPGLGAYVRWEAMGVTRVTRAAISLAGPLAGLLGAVVCFYLWKHTGNQMWAALARASAWLNILNLIPIWVLDGGQAALALSKTERWILLFVAVLLWLQLREGVFFFVGAGIVYRLFTKDVPPLPAPQITAYYSVVLAGLGILLYFVPGHLFPQQ
jgi:Zn-dependent protease